MSGNGSCIWGWVSVLTLIALFRGSPTYGQDVVDAAGTEAAGTWSYSMGTATDNRSKGVSRSEGDPYGWIEARWRNPSSGLYFTSGFDIDQSSSQLDASVGFRRPSAGFDLDLELTHKWTLTAASGEVAREWDLTAQASRSLGPAEISVVIQYSPVSLESHAEWTWVESRFAWAFSPALKASAAVGRREQDDDVDYTAWNIGVTVTSAPNTSIDIRYYDTDARDAGETYDSALVAAVSLAF